MSSFLDLRGTCLRIKSLISQLYFSLREYSKFNAYCLIVMTSFEIQLQDCILKKEPKLSNIK